MLLFSSVALSESVSLFVFKAAFCENKTFPKINVAAKNNNATMIFVILLFLDLLFQENLLLFRPGSVCLNWFVS